MTRLSSLGALAGCACVAVLAVACHDRSATDVAPTPSASSSTARIIASVAPDPRYIPKPSADPEASAEGPATDASASAQPLPKAPATTRAKTAHTEPARAATPTASSTAAPDPPSPPVEAKTPPPPKQHVVRGTSVGAEHFTLSIQAPTPIQTGKTASATIVLTAKSPFHCNNKYPYKFKLDAPDGAVSYPSAVARGMSVSGRHGSLAVPFSAKQAGKATISGTLSMSVCSSDKCLMDKRHLTVVVQIL